MSTEEPAAVAARPRWGVVLFLAVLGMATLGLNSVRPAFGLPLSDLVFLASLLAIGFKSLVGRTQDLSPTPVRRGHPMVLQGAILLLVGGGVSTFISWNVGTAAGELIRVGYVTIAWFWILRTVARDLRVVRLLMAAWVASAAITALIPYILPGTQPENREGRAVGMMNHSNEFGLLLAVALPLAVLGAWQGPGPTARRQMALRWVASVSILAGIGASGSMTTALAAVVGIGASGLAVAVRRSSVRTFNPLRPVYVLGAVLAVGGLLLSADVPLYERFERLQQGESRVVGSVDTRVDLNQYVIQNLDDSLVLGVGLDRASSERDLPQVGSGVTVHNMFLKLLHEGGLPALVGLVIINVVVIRQSIVLLRVTRRDARRLMAALLGALLAANVLAFFGPLLYQRSYWAPVAFVGCMWSLVREGHVLPEDLNQVSDP